MQLSDIGHWHWRTSVKGCYTRFPLGLVVQEAQCVLLIGIMKCICPYTYAPKRFVKFSTGQLANSFSWKMDIKMTCLYAVC